ncbi:MAG: ferrous iron transport protein B [Acholeplasmataceae bacterium]|nr:ferrous iron transport protein B [Acholeplasmataceae bacterium]
MRIALVGNQNSGKTTLFNLLTGNNQKIGNWPGVTIEKKIGIIRGTDHELIDLPGVYSLSPYSPEEQIARQFLFSEDIDLILNVIDATSIERSLYLSTQLLELKIPMLIALNMSDLLENRGIKIDIDLLMDRLDTTILPISATKKTNVFNLIQTIKKQDYRKNNYTHFYDHIMEKTVESIEAEINLKHQRFVTMKMIEGDLSYDHYITESISEKIQNLRKNYQRDLEQVIADERYRYIEYIRDEAIDSKLEKMTWTDKIDNILLNRYLAIPIFVVIMFLIYYFAAGPVGGFTVDFVSGFMETLKVWTHETLISLNASTWSASLVTDGILAGVGAILSFLPQLIILFFLISLLETTGYMARIAFFLDRIFQKMGLSGKSLIPFIIGSGCSVPAIMSARTIPNETEKKMTIMLTPFIPCSAKLPIITLFAGYFFEEYAGLVSASLYFLAIMIIMVSALILKRIFVKGKPSTFILELPHYKVPHMRFIIRDVYEKVKEFISHAGSVILFASLVIWILISFSWSFKYGIHPDQSILASVGKILSYIFYPMLGTLNWGTSVSAIQGLIAKEQVVASMAIIAGLSDTNTDGLLIFGSQAFAFFTAPSAYAFMVFNLFSAPCFGSIGAMRQELGTTKRMWTAVLFQTGMAWLLAVIIFQLGSLIGGLVS